jgi:DnaK suppressor protein
VSEQEDARAGTLTALRLTLRARCAELTASIAEGRRSDRPVSPDKAIGRLTRQDAMQQQQMSAELIRRHEQDLIRVQKALHAIDDGTYGLCQRCGDPIAAARLNAVPHASHCVRCAEQPSDRRR